MSPNKRLLQNLLFSALMLLCLVGVYLYAGYAQRQQASAPQQTQTAPPAGPPAAPEFSGDGRLLSGFLAAFAASGYAVGADRAPGEYLLYDSSLNAVCTLIPALQGQRVSGATLQFPLPQKPETANSPGAIEQTLLDRYAEASDRLYTVLPPVFDAALSALDPYGEVPSTARLRWHDLLLDAAKSGRSASDAGETILLDAYFAETDGTAIFCIALQWK